MHKSSNHLYTLIWKYFILVLPLFTHSHHHTASAFLTHPSSSHIACKLRMSSDVAMPMETPPPATPANVLYSLVSANRKRAYENKELLSAIPLAGIHDALSAKIFAQKGAPALFLSGFGVSASLLGVPDAGVTSLVEMEQVTRNICSAMRSHKDFKVPPPLIVDGDTGYGGSPNMLRTISSLASAGAAAITIEDQVFPKKCTIAAGEKIRIVEREEAVERVRGALGARDLYCERVSLSTTENTSSGAGCWIVARTDCRLAFGFEEVVERCLRFEELGAEIVYAENLQSIDEYLKLREKLDPRSVTMVAQVQETILRPGLEKQRKGKPLLDTKTIGELGYDLALFGVTPLQSVMGTLMSVADQFYQNNGIIGSNLEVAGEQLSMIDFDIVKQIVGFDELEDFERKYPCG